VTAQADGTNQEGLWVCAVGKILVVAIVIGAVMLPAIGFPVIIVTAIIIAAIMLTTQAVPWTLL